MNKKQMTLMSILIVGVAAAGIMYAVSTTIKSANPGDSQNAGAQQFCQTRDEAVAKTEGKIQVKEPSYLPNGYNFQCADGSTDSLLLFYGDGRSIDMEKANRNDLIANGSILIATRRADPQVTDRDYEIKHMFDNKTNPDQKTRLTDINGNLAAVREQCTDCGKGFITYENGTTVQTGSFGLPSDIIYYDGGQQYLIEANMPSEVLEKIAISIK